MKGLNPAGRGAPPVYVPVKTTSSVVVTPGLTGLPSRPLKLISTARLVRRASTPPTMLPGGHFMRQERWGNRDPKSRRGTTTHGPATGMHTGRPRHSSAAIADGAASTASTAAAADERTHGLHGSLLNQLADSAPPSRSMSTPPAANATVTSRHSFSLPSRDWRSPYTTSSCSRVGAVKNLPPVARATARNVSGAAGTSTRAL